RITTLCRRLYANGHKSVDRLFHCEWQHHLPIVASRLLSCLVTLHRLYFLPVDGTAICRRMGVPPALQTEAISMSDTVGILLPFPQASSLVATRPAMQRQQFEGIVNQLVTQLRARG